MSTPLIVTEEQFKELNDLREQYKDDVFRIGRHLNYSMHSEISNRFKHLRSMDIVDVHTAAVTGNYSLPLSVKDVIHRRRVKANNNGSVELREELSSLLRELDELKLI